MPSTFGLLMTCSAKVFPDSFEGAGTKGVIENNEYRTSDPFAASLAMIKALIVQQTLSLEGGCHAKYQQKKLGRRT